MVHYLARSDGLEDAEKMMSIFEWVNFMIGVDLEYMPEYDYLIIGTSSALLIILFSSVYTLLLSIGGIISPRRQ